MKISHAGQQASHRNSQVTEVHLEELSRIGKFIEKESGRSLRTEKGDSGKPCSWLVCFRGFGFLYT